jgi:carbamoyl-phosphate synthase large subunit
LTPILKLPLSDSDVNLCVKNCACRVVSIRYVGDVFRAGWTRRGTRADQYRSMVLIQLEDLIKEARVAEEGLESLAVDRLRQLKRKGFADSRLAKLIVTDEASVRRRRQRLGVRPVYKRVDTCAAEFATSTAYMYSTYEEECEANPTDRKKIMILGGGPNRIGQGIEFDYCCVHAAFALRDAGYETIMVNCNPETVSTDYDTSDRLYFEPLTFEDVMEIIDKEKPVGVIVQYGGQTPLKLCRALEAAGAPIIGTSPDAIDVAEDRERFQQLVTTCLEAAAESHRAHRRCRCAGGARNWFSAGGASLVCAGWSRDGSGVHRRRSARLHD